MIVKEIKTSSRRNRYFANVRLELTPKEYRSLNLKDDLLEFTNPLNEKLERNAKMEEIDHIITSYFDTSREDLSSKYRGRNAVKIRKFSWYMMKKYTKESLGSLGLFYNRDHASVIHNLRKFDIDLEKDYDDSRKHLHNLIELYNRFN